MRFGESGLFAETEHGGTKIPSPPLGLPNAALGPDLLYI